ncbi:TAR RNA loop binding protein [Heterostelium album PN500]|uniref:tRNA (guanosine(18)-2'-O)-methyltransferase TARBP1 n=1 Tax=Heterostelium pallidum (strain ATCC 26659 / Pp 5 / PN500) TaxID=670386 RepID=D3AYG8_HETP5|nr:TAR RNA loop binding protein [Heterostelium album PN500]EFA85995.1 TAR RNA loop binding protein [Heterostelium album PN500]|eukprot:XP_020438101.1 TAR RNA loop binding protein [Heterostelium album PN500]
MGDTDIYISNSNSFILNQLNRFSDSIAEQYSQQKIIDIASVDLIFISFIESLFSASLFTTTTATHQNETLRNYINQIEQSILSTFKQYNNNNNNINNELQVKQSFYLQLLLHSLDSLVKRLTSSQTDNNSNKQLSSNVIDIYITVLAQLNSGVASSSQSIIVLISNLLSNTLLRVSDDEFTGSLIRQLQQSLISLTTSNEHNDHHYHLDQQQQQQQSSETTTTTTKVTANNIKNSNILYTILSSLIDSQLNQNNQTTSSLSIRKFVDVVYEQQLLTPLLMSDNVEQRQSLIVTLLPSLLRCSSVAQCQSLVSTVMKMFTIAEHEIKSDAFKILARQYDTFFSSSIVDLTYSPDFWRYLIQGFIDADPLIRKRSNYLLKKTIKRSIDETQNTCVDAPNRCWSEYFRWSAEESEQLQKQWDTFFLINETLDEFNVHLIAPVWREIDSLIVHQSPLHFAWLDILFQRVMLHENPAVIKAQVLEILNSTQYIPKLPMEFIFGTLIRAITNTILYRGITEDRIHPSIQYFLETYYNSLSTDLQSVFLSKLLNVISSTEYFSAFTMSILSFISKSNTNRNNLQLCFLNDKNIDQLLNLLEITRRMNHLHRSKIYKYTIEILVTLSIKDDLSFSNVTKVLYSIPMQIHTVPECNESIGKWLNTGFSSVNHNGSWLSDNIVKEIELNCKDGSLDVLSYGDSFVAMKSRCYMLSRMLIYTSSERFDSIIKNNIINHIQLNNNNNEPLNYQTINNLLLLATVLSNSLSTKQSNNIKTLLQSNDIDFANNLIRYIINHDILSNNNSISNNIVKLEFGDSLATIVSFIVDIVDQTLLNQYIEKLESFRPTNSKLWSDQIKTINMFQSLYGLFGKIHQLYSFEHLQKIITIYLPITLLRPQDNSEDTGLNASSWGTTLAYFMKIKWKCIRNILSILQDSGKLKNLEDSNELLEVVIDAISGSNRFSIKAILDCAQILLVFAKNDENGDFNLDVVERIVSSAYASANDTHFTSMAAFIQLTFSPALLSHLPTSEETSHHYILKKYFKLVLNLSESIMGLMNLLLLKCSPVWIEQPEISLYYIDEIYQSIIFGPIRKDDEWENNEKTSTQFYDPMIGYSTFVLDMGIEATYENEVDEIRFGVGAIPLKDVFGRAVVATFIKKMATLSTVENSNKSKYLEFTNTLANHLIDINLTKEFTKKIEHLINTQPHRKRIRIWQILCLLAPYMVPTSMKEIGKKLTDIIFTYNLPSTRRYINIFTINLVTRFQSLVSSHFIPKIMALCSSHHLSVRNAAIGMVIKIINSKHLVGKLDQSVLDYLKHLEWYIHNNTQTSKSLERHVAHLSLNDEGLKSSCDFTNLFYDIPSLEKLSSSEISAPGIFEFLVDHIVQHSPLTAQLRHFLLLKSRVESTATTTTTESTSQDEEDDEEGKESKIDGDDYIESSGANQVVGYQKKILPWNDVEDETRYNIMARTRQQLIIVATFVDKIPNLAGLARTSEIFNVESLVVSKKKVANDPMFQQISVSAERWLPMTEVEEHQLREYLLSKKQEGYTLLGVEQTSTSSQLNEYKFPEKAVLLLGKEKEGIPTEYINLLDKCIEIPQLGIIRSLNVHVSGSILMWEYTKQMINNKK